MADTLRSTAPPSDIKSRPRYGTLHPVPTAQWNVIAAEGVGIHAVIRMLSDAPEDFAGRSHIVYTQPVAAAEDTHDLDVARAFGLAQVDVLSDVADVLERLDALLDAARMGTRLYVVGGESFVGRVVQYAAHHHVDPESVVTELSGSLSRRVQCVHCKHITDNVLMTHYKCLGCGLTLLVRDHYSRRLAAFQGVSATAEDPDETPEPMELYQ